MTETRQSTPFGRSSAMAGGRGAVARLGAATAGQVAAMGRLPWPVGLYLFSLLVPMWFQAGPLMMNSMRLMLLLVTVPLLFRILSGAYGRVLATDILFVLHILWVSVALAVNNPDRVVQSVGSTGIEFIGGYVLARAYIRERAQFLALCRWLSVLLVLSLPLALFEALTGVSPILRMIEALPVVSGPAPTLSNPRLGLERVRLSLAHPIHFGLLAAVVFSLCFVGLKGVWSDSTRLWASAAIALCCMLSLSAGGLVALQLQFGLILWAWALANVQNRWLVLLGVVAFVYVLVDILSNRTPLQVFMTYATFSPETAWWRYNVVEWGLVNIRNSPVFGIGLNDWVRPLWMYSGSVDNFWMVVAMRYGVPAFACLALGYGLALWQVGRAELGADAGLRQMRLAWMFTFVGLTFTLATVHVWHGLYSFVFFMFGAGLWLISARPQAADAAPAAPPRPGSLRFTRFPNGAETPPPAEAPPHRQPAPKRRPLAPGAPRTHPDRRR